MTLPIRSESPDILQILPCTLKLPLKASMLLMRCQEAPCVPAYPLQAGLGLNRSRYFTNPPLHPSKHACPRPFNSGIFRKGSTTPIGYVIPYPQMVPLLGEPCGVSLPDHQGMVRRVKIAPYRYLTHPRLTSRGTTSQEISRSYSKHEQ